MNNYVFCLMGPTAAGKTDLACQLHQHCPVEIISVDSAMIYRGMDIGTAKPDRHTLSLAPHHLLDILDPCDSYSAATFCEEVHALCKEIFSRGKYPLLVGGTMMYFRALQQGLSRLPEANDAVRKDLLAQANTHGWDRMHQILATVDPITAARVHPHDTQRIQRALEVYQLTAKPLSAFLQAEKASSTYRFINLILMPEDRQWLHQRIALRFEQMLHEGFLAEVEALVKQWQLTPNHASMRSVGYRQALVYLAGACDFAAFKDSAVAATRQLAKRQLTWLRHWPDGFVCQAESHAISSETMAIMQKLLDNNGLL